MVSEHGDDKNDGLTDKTLVRTAAQAIKVANRTGAGDIRVLGDASMRNRLTSELERERKKKKRP